MLKRRQGEKNYYIRAFVLGLGLSFLVFIPFMAIDGGRFLFYGDFNVQQVPFYRLAHDAIRSGQLGWSQHTDLGANFIGSYSFYLLGSPFFWLTIPFPSEWMQYMMGPLLILKFACASLTGYIYLHRYTKTPDTALIGSILYAFSGFSIYNIFFNHFHEAIVFFPLLLAALDEYMATRRRGLFALAVAACCFVNYYFFVGQVTFTLIYFFLRMLWGDWRLSFRDFLFLALEAVLGVGISCALLVPSILAVLQNSRTGNIINGWNAVLYNKNQRYLHILECFFFPPDLPARPNFTPESESRWASLGAWLPLFSMSGVIGWLQLRRKHWLKKLLWTLFFMALVPGLNSAFQMMNSAYYARWFYMLTLMMALATVMSLEEERVDWKRSLVWTLSITLGITAVVGFTPVSETVDGEQSVSFGLMQYPTRFWSYAAISLISLAALFYVFTFRRDSRRSFQRGTIWAASIVSVLYSIFFIALGKTQSDYTWDHLIPYSLNGGASIDLPDLQQCRSDFYESVDNAGMFWKVPTIQAFHSVVPGSVMEFYSSVGVQRDVASRPETSHYGVRALTTGFSTTTTTATTLPGRIPPNPLCPAGPIMATPTASISGKTSITSPWAFPMTTISPAASMKSSARAQTPQQGTGSLPCCGQWCWRTRTCRTLRGFSPTCPRKTGPSTKASIPRTAWTGRPLPASPSSIPAQAFPPPWIAGVFQRAL